MASTIATGSIAMRPQRERVLEFVGVWRERQLKSWGMVERRFIAWLKGQQMSVSDSSGVIVVKSRDG